MIATYHGHDIDLPALRRRFPLSLRGASLHRLIGVAQQLGLHGRGLRLDLDALDQLKVPCILHWDLGHFVVLKRVTSRGLETHDPALGILRLSRAETSKHFTGIALELTRMPDFSPMRDRRPVSLARLAGHIRGFGRGAAEILALALALEAFALIV